MAIDLSQLLYSLVSENSEIRSKAYVEFTKYEEQPDFSYRLFQIYLTSTEPLKSLALSASTNVISRNLLKTDFSAFKLTLLQLLYKIRIEDDALAEAKRIIFLLRKIIRSEYPQKWPELLKFQIDTLQECLKEENYKIDFQPLRTWIFLSNYIVKEQISKRLIRACNDTYYIGNVLYPLVTALWYRFNNPIDSNQYFHTSTLLDSLAIRLLYYGQRRPYLDKGTAALLSAILLKMTNLFKCKFQCSYFYKNINKLFKLLTHLINHDPLLFACIDYGLFLIELTDFLSSIKNLDFEVLVQNGLLLINAVFSSLGELPETTDAPISLDHLTPDLNISVLKNSASGRFQAHLRDRPIEWYVKWLLDNFLYTTDPNGLSSLPTSLTRTASFEVLKTISSGQHGAKIALLINAELSLKNFDFGKVDVLLQLIKSAVPVAKQLDHALLLPFLERVIYNSENNFLRLRALDAIDSLIENYNYSEEESERLLNILIYSFSYEAVIPIHKLYDKTNEFYYWQRVDSTGATVALNIFYLVVDLFISATVPSVRADCMNLLSKLIKELDLQSEEIPNQLTCALTDILRIYKESSWDLRESILLMASSLMNSFDMYKCFLYLPNNLSIYYFIAELLVQTLYVRNTEYLESFFSVWLLFLRILPEDLTKTSSIVLLLDNLVGAQGNFEYEILYEIVLEYLAIIICLYKYNYLEVWKINEYKITLFLNLIENILRSEIFINNILIFINFLPERYFTRFIIYSNRLLETVLNHIENANQDSLLAAISYGVHHPEHFYNNINISNGTYSTLKKLYNNTNTHIKVYYSFLYNSIAKKTNLMERLPIVLTGTEDNQCRTHLSRKYLSQKNLSSRCCLLIDTIHRKLENIN